MRRSSFLALPDFDSQNIMIDEHGDVTGIIDWDNVQTFPKFLGYSRSPGWITRDWDPVMYGYPRARKKNSPEELKRYRRRYDCQMKKLLHRGGNSRFTGKSHIFEAVALAAMSDISRLEIVRKIVGRVFRNAEDHDSQEIIQVVGQGRLDQKDMRKLNEGLRALLSLSGKGQR